eukprot:scaffold80440_cov44-Prasinocladus_malaysianus.AAC.1
MDILEFHENGRCLNPLCSAGRARFGHCAQLIAQPAVSSGCRLHAHHGRKPHGVQKPTDNRGSPHARPDGAVL